MLTQHGDQEVEAKSDEPGEFMEKKLATTAEAFCYLVHVAGDLDVAADRIRIVRRNGNWVLQTRGGTTSAREFSFLAHGPLQVARDVRARARCLPFDQFN